MVVHDVIAMEINILTLHFLLKKKKISLWMGSNDSLIVLIFFLVSPICGSNFKPHLPFSHYLPLKKLHF